jgi:hypothetical protein
LAVYDKPMIYYPLSTPSPKRTFVKKRLWRVPPATGGIIMKIHTTNIPDVRVFEPRVHGDERGYFMETFRQSTFDKLGLNFVQDNHSRSSRHVLRGLHYQVERPRGSWCG